MATSELVQKLEFNEIHALFSEYPRLQEATKADKEILLDVSLSVLEIWCWLRNDGQVHMTPESLCEITQMLGMARMCQLLKRIDIPKPIIERANKAIEKHFQDFKNNPDVLKRWDSDLHPKFFVPFVIETCGASQQQ